MNTPPAQLFGRENAVKDLLDSLAVIKGQASTGTFVHIVSGVEGVGKTAFLETVVARLRMGQKDYWVFPFPKVFVQGQVSKTLLEATRSAVRCRELSESAWSRFLLSVNPGASVAHSLKDLQTIHGVHWVKSLEHALLTASAGLRVLVLVDDMDRWPSDMRTLWLNEFWRVVNASSVASRIELVASVSDSAQVDELMGVLGVDERKTDVLNLPALSAEDSEKIARQWLPGSTDITDLLKKAEGLPAKIRELAKQRIQSTGVTRTDARVESITKGCSLREVALLYAGCLLDQVCLDGVDLLVGSVREREVQWLKRRLLPFCDRKGVLPMDLREQLIDWVDKNRKDLPLIRNKLAPRINSIISMISDEHNRRAMLPFSVFTRFDEKLLGKVFEGDASRMLAFAKSNPSYFEEENGVIRITPYYLGSIKDYASMMGYDADDSISQRIAKYWAQERKQFEEELKQLKGQMSEQEHTRKDVVGELEQLVKKIDRLRPKNPVKAKRRAKPRKQAQERDFMQRFAGSSLVVGGIFVLYAGILITGQFNMGYGIIGMVMVFWGFYFALRKKAVPVSVTPVREPVQPRQSDSQRKELRALELRQLNLENRKASLGMNLVEGRRRVAYIESCLKQPLS